MRFKTLTARVGTCTDSQTGAISTPIYQTATFRHEGIGKSTGYDYSRTANPTRRALEEGIRDLEGGHGGFAFSSGMAAITAVLMLFSPGDHLVVSDDLYGGTYRLLQRVFKGYGIVATYADTSVPEEIDSAVQPNTRGLLLETPTNPLMKITDLRAAARIAKDHGLLSIVDNTFMTPYFQRPLEMGIDLVVHSGTKFLGGHNDCLSGLVVTGSEDLSTRIQFLQNSTGGVLGPMDSFFMLRGMKTLALRLAEQEKNALILARWLQDHPQAAQVYYPGLSDHPGHAVHQSQATGFGAVLSFRTKDAAAARRVIEAVRLIPFAESLGGVETLITYPVFQTHGDIPKEMRDAVGVTEDLLRLSVGIEAAEDLMEDLDQALCK